MFAKKSEDDRLMDFILDHINGKRSLKDEHGLVLEKKSELPSRHRQHLIKIFADKKQPVTS